MRHALLALFLCTASVASAQTPEAIEDTIAGQIQAFRTDDLATAFTFASPMIQGMFGTPENFGAMVRNGYPMVWRPADVEFFDRAPRGPSVWQRVRILDGAGAEHWFAYEMIRIDGNWRINGVYPVDPPHLGV